MRNLLDAVWPQDGSIQTLLDLGCGDLWFTAGLPGVLQHTGVDLWQPSLDKAGQKNVPGFRAYCMDLREYVRLQADASYDAVLAIDVIEHFSEEEGKFLVGQMERVARKLVAVWTTLGFIEQGPYSNDGEYNPYQEHHCGPTPDWFSASNGWKVDEYPDWHGPRGGAIFAYNFLNKKPAFDPLGPVGPLALP